MVNTFLLFIKKTNKHASQRRKYEFVFLLFLMMLTGIFESISIGAVIPFIAIYTDPNIVVNNEIFQDINSIFMFEINEIILAVTLLFIVAAILSATFKIFLLSLSTKFSYLFANELNEKIFQKVLEQSYEEYVYQNSAELIDGVVRKTDILAGYGVVGIVNLISALIMLFFIFLTLIFVNIEISIFVFFTFIIIYLSIIRLVRRKLNNNSKSLAKNAINVIKNLEDGFGSYRDILLNNYQKLYLEQFNKSDLKLRNAQINNIIIKNSPKYIVETFGIISLVVVAYFFSRSLENMSIMLPTIAAFAFSAQKAFPLAQQIYSSAVGFLGHVGLIDESLNLLDKKSSSQFKVNNKLNISFNNKIEFSNVSFHYKNKCDLVFEDLNLTLKKGQKVGIIGSTGSGKSTLIDLLMGLLEPTEGDIKVDGKKLNFKQIQSWQGQISHLPQTIFLKNGTIKENIIGISDEKQDLKHLQYVSNVSCLTDAIKKFPEKYDTKIGERGIRLSGGQRQRIGLARCFYNLKKGLLILDESTSALDNTTESKVMKNIYKMIENKLVIIITHRHSILKDCDVIYKIKNKKISLVSNLN